MKITINPREEGLPVESLNECISKKVITKIQQNFRGYTELVSWLTEKPRTWNNLREIGYFRRIINFENFSEEILCSLATDSDPLVRETIASREYLSDNLIRILAKDPGWYTRTLIARRTDLPSDLIAFLYCDSNPNVRRALEETHKISITTTTISSDYTTFYTT